MYITVKKIGKSLFESVLIILLMLLNFTVAFTKKINFTKFSYNFPCMSYYHL